MTCSIIGIAIYPQDGADMDELLRHADKAMYGVKEGGRAGYRFHQPTGTWTCAVACASTMRCAAR